MSPKNNEKKNSGHNGLNSKRPSHNYVDERELRDLFNINERILYPNSNELEFQKFQSSFKSFDPVSNSLPNGVIEAAP